MLWDRILDKCSIKADSESVSESESAARGTGNEATPASVLRRCFFTVNLFYLSLLF